jgi:hypothetical protein
MKRLLIFLAIPFLVIVFLCGAWAGDGNSVNRQAALPFVTLPEGVIFPEGITANPNTGEIIVGTFNTSGDNYLLRYSKNGKLLAEKNVGGTPLLGLAFNDQKIYIANFGASMIQRIDADFNDSTPIDDVAVVPMVGPPPDRFVQNPDGTQDQISFGLGDPIFPSPNGLVFNNGGDLYFSDSFQGAIFRIDDAGTCSLPCAVTTVIHDGMLATAGFPPFGANGLALSTDESILFITNTGDDRVLTLDLDTLDIGVFAESINGADGIAFDQAGRLWVVGNQADQLVILNLDGRGIFEMGEFLGLENDGSPRGLLFPASLVMSGQWVYVTNLALHLTPAVGDEPEEDITTYTVSRIKIPK